MAEHNLVGIRGENLAVEFLIKKGYKIIERNWRFRKAELDMIAKIGNQLVVVEVKTRTSEHFENPKEAVTITKQRNIVRATDAYIQEKEIDLECRFDIVSVLILNEKVSIEHIEDAFYPLL